MFLWSRSNYHFKSWLLIRIKLLRQLIFNTYGGFLMAINETDGLQIYFFNYSLKKLKNFISSIINSSMVKIYLLLCFQRVSNINKWVLKQPQTPKIYIWFIQFHYGILIQDYLYIQNYINKILKYFKDEQTLNKKNISKLQK